MRLKLVLAYDGTNYSGWQIQENAPATIQGTVERAFFRLLGQPVRLFGSGRTDAGVHALGQTAHCDVPRMLADWRKALNAALPQDIRVLSAALAPPGFHARTSAASKTYIYNFWTERAFTPPQMRAFCWPCGRLDAAAMRMALPGLAGRHDFAALQNAGTPQSSTERSIFSISLEETAPAEFLPPHSPPLRLSVTADGFLKQMVRNIAGLLAWVGMGKLGAGDVPGVLAGGRGDNPAPTAPARGLFLARVHYGNASGED